MKTNRRKFYKITGLTIFKTAKVIKVMAEELFQIEDMTTVASVE